MATPNAGNVETLVSQAEATAPERSYFAASKYSTPATTPSTTPSINPDDGSLVNYPKTINLGIPALMREFPKPAEELDVKAALERQPGRWTIQGQIDANERRARQAIDEEKAREKRVQDFEATKRDLLASYQTTGQEGRNAAR